MAHILKFGAAVEDIGNLEFTTPVAAITYWCDNMLEQHNSDWCQVDDVEFVQVGPMLSGYYVVFTKANVDSRGFSFVVTNPQNYQQLGGLGISFNGYRCATVIYNRVALAQSYPFGGVNVSAYHALDEDAVLGVYNCVGYYCGDLTGVAGTVANFRVMNSYIASEYSGGIGPSGVNVRSIEVMNCFMSRMVFSVFYYALPSFKFRNNVLCSASMLGDGSTVVNGSLNNISGDLLAKIKAELPYNVFCFNFADSDNSAGVNASIDNIDPTRRGVSVFALYPHLWERTGTAFPTGYISYLPHRNLQDLHQMIEDYTPRRVAMAQIGPPEPRDGNPLRYFLNGWDANNGEQYGPCGYDWQEDYEFASPMLTVTPLPTLEMRLNWTIPPDLPAKFTKWEIYKRAAPPPATLFHFLNQNTTPKPTKIGEVARNVTTFLDDGSALTSVLGTEVSYRIRPVVA